MENNKNTREIPKSGSAEYRCWAAMKGRCLNKNHGAYSDYGGRGIIVCESWMEFENFYHDMGLRPKGMSLDRIDNDGNYEPSNCKWSTEKEQQNNKRKYNVGKQSVNVKGMVLRTNYLKLKAISAIIGKSKDEVLNEAIELYIEKNKGCFYD